LVTDVIRTFYGIVHMLFPMVFVRIT